MKCVALGALALAVAAGSASADITITLTNQTFTGFNFLPAANQGDLIGSLTSVSVSAVLTASTAETYADDLCIYLKNDPLAFGGALQVGGFSNLSATQRYFWANGGSDVVGTTVIDTVTLTTPIDISQWKVWVGNGYGGTGTSGTWTGTITLHGVDIVPAPGTAALLGLGGLVALRRRR